MKQTILVLLCSLFYSAAFTQSEIGSSPQKIKLLSWNIYMLPGFIGQASMKTERAGAIGQLLAASDYDVIVFQEAFCPQARKKIKKYLAPKFPYLAGPANQKKFSLKVNSGLWIFSRYPMVASHSIVYKSRVGVDALSRKGALLVELNVNGQLIQVAGTHMQNAGGHSIRHAQCQEFSESLLKPHAKEGVPQLLCGDFNINKENKESYQFMLTSLDASDGELSGEYSYSYDRQINDLRVEQGDGRDLIDYVLLRDNNSWITCSSRKIKPIRTQWHKSHQDLSDHFSLEAEILFSNKPASLASSRK